MDERLSRHDLTDEQWALLAPHPRQGHRWTDHRLVIDGVFHRTRTGTPWRDLSARFGPWQTVYNRHLRWSADGTWERILAALQTGTDVPDGRSGGQVWTVAVDRPSCGHISMRPGLGTHRRSTCPPTASNRSR